MKFSTILGIGLLICSSASAESLFVIKSENQQLVNKLSQVEAILPQKMIDNLGYQIKVKLTDNESKVYYNLVSLNQNFRIKLKVDSDIEKMQRDLLLATLEIFDRDNIKDRDELEGEDDYRYCKEQFTELERQQKEAKQNDQHFVAIQDLRACYQLVKSGYNYSTDPQFLGLAGWSIDGAGSRKLHQMDSDNGRIIDGEYQNAQQSFILNMEKFLTDPSYKCRKPSLYRYFESEFDHVPFENYQCETNNTVAVHVESILSRNSAIKTIDPDRIYRVDYVIAGPTVEMPVTYFGHAMTRVVVCKPGRPLGPDCLKDYDHHFFVSYEGTVYDGIIEAFTRASSIDMVSGKLPGVMQILDYTETMAKYMYVQGRDITFYPIRFDRAGINRFATRLIEDYWKHSGHYHFKNRNCADGSFELLRSSLPYNIDLYNDYITAPKGIVDLFNKFNIIDTDNITVEKQQVSTLAKYFFPYILVTQNTLRTKILDLTDKEIEKIANTESHEFLNSLLIYRYINTGKRYIDNLNAEIDNAVAKNIEIGNFKELQQFDSVLGNSEEIGFYPKNYGVPLKNEVTLNTIDRNKLANKMMDMLESLVPRPY